MKIGTRGQLTLYSLLHFCVDWACILLITGQVRLKLHSYQDWLWCVLLYNAFAFALQLPLGAMLDALGRQRQAAALGCGLVAAGWLCRSSGLPACVVSGVGNALFHLGSGSEVLAHSGGKAGPSGIFVSTGAVGVWLGVWCAQMGDTAAWPPLAVMALGAILTLLCQPGVPPPCPWKAPDKLRLPLLTGALFLFLTVCLRSWAGGMMAFPWKTGWLSLAAVICVAGGKAAGGLLGDRFGCSACAGVTLTLSALLLPLSFSHPAAGLFALFLFNTSMPLTLTGLTRALGLARRGLAFGLTTFALFLGTLPRIEAPVWVLCAAALASAALLPAGLKLSTGEENRP